MTLVRIYQNGSSPGPAYTLVDASELPPDTAALLIQWDEILAYYLERIEWEEARLVDARDDEGVDEFLAAEVLRGGR